MQREEMKLIAEPMIVVGRKRGARAKGEFVLFTWTCSWDECQNKRRMVLTRFVTEFDRPPNRDQIV